MKISFFEEFPTQTNLAKLKYVNFTTKIYLTAESLKEFKKLKSEIVKNYKQVKEVVYWPILKKKEGYWISPFSKRKALLRIFNELKNNDNAVMLDLELPTRHNPLLYFTQAINFFRNKKLVSKFIKNYQGEIYLAEYFPEGKVAKKLLNFLGLHFKHSKVKVIKMFYSSLHNFNPKFVKKEFDYGVKELGSNYLIALGTISVGIHNKEPILSEEKLRRDLLIAKKSNVQEVIIFRLGGMNKKYQNVLKN